MSTRTAAKPVLDKYSARTSRQLVSIMEGIASLYPSCDAAEWKQALSTELEAQTVGLEEYMAEIFRCALPGISAYIVNRYMAALLKAGSNSFPTQGAAAVGGDSSFPTQGPAAGIPQQTPGPSCTPGAMLPPRPIQLAFPILERVDALIASITDIRQRQRAELDELHNQHRHLEVLVQEKRDELRHSEEAERILPALREVSLAHPDVDSVEGLVEIARVVVPDFTIATTTVGWMRERLTA